MVAADHNGDKFHYIVRYRLASALIGNVKKIDSWRQNELVVVNQPTFAQYEISVEAVNALGSAPADILETVIGYSGEDGILHNNYLQSIVMSLISVYHKAKCWELCKMFVAS